MAELRGFAFSFEIHPFRIVSNFAANTLSYTALNTLGLLSVEYCPCLFHVQNIRLVPFHEIQWFITIVLVVQNLGIFVE